MIVDFTPDPPPGYGRPLAALRDQQIGRAIALVHRDPARNWTVASLAMAVGMSRSAFAARFSQLVGEPAVRYVTLMAGFTTVQSMGSAVSLRDSIAKGMLPGPRILTAPR